MESILFSVLSCRVFKALKKRMSVRRSSKKDATEKKVAPKADDTVSSSR
jgi:hypothetical protein